VRGTVAVAISSKPGSEVGVKVGKRVSMTMRREVVEALGPRKVQAKVDSVKTTIIIFRLEQSRRNRTNSGLWANVGFCRGILSEYLIVILSPTPVTTSCRRIKIYCKYLTDFCNPQSNYFGYTLWPIFFRKKISDKI
jgi:hypothetical protein